MARVVPESILIVEDEETVADVLALNLGLEGFEVEIALSGIVGLAMARDGGFDLVICDVMLPDMDGYEICRRLKSAGSLLPVLLLTGRTEAEDSAAAMRCGADDFLIKPFDLGELLARVHMSLERSALARGLDPLTGLPGGVEADEALRRRILSGEPTALMLFSVNHLKPYREVYGDERVEDVIRFVGRMLDTLVKGLGDGEDVAARIGGAEFSVLTSPGPAERIAHSAIEMFDEGIVDFYSENDALDGVIRTFDRRGAIIDNPLMTVSVGIASNKHRSIPSHWEAAEIAREVLNHAKTLPVSSCVFDRRKVK